jgi:UDP-GlcNAc:undecaprenyl-phosphate GlcNAc-1-phosphate transferase
MVVLALVFTSSLLLGLLLTPLARAAAARCGLVDAPDGRRKLHARPVPVAGGPAVLLAAGGAVALAWAAGLPWPAGADDPALLGLIPAGLWICALGVLDDLGKLRGRHKLAGQALAAGMLVAAGVQVRTVHLFGWGVDLGPLSVPFTLFFLLGAMNSLNLIDGMDGLLSSVALILFLALGALSVLGGHAAAAVVALAFAGAALGFLRYNFPPASVFLGDSGSMVLGLAAGALAVQGSLKAPAAAALAAPGALLAVPMFDTLAAILRRKLTGRSIYATDRGHLHHCLLRRGLTTRRALLLVAACCSVTSAGAVASLAFRNEFLAVASAVLVLGVLVTTRLFGHAELSLLCQRLRGTAASFLSGPAPDEPDLTEVRLHGLADWPALWQRVLAAADRLGLQEACLDVNAPSINEGYHARWRRRGEADEAGGGWRAEVPLAVDGKAIGRLEVSGLRDGNPVGRKIAALAELMPDLELTAARLADSARPAPPAPTPSGLILRPAQAV